jgi:hypothetical protein
MLRALTLVHHRFFTAAKPQDAPNAQTWFGPMLAIAPPWALIGRIARDAAGRRRKPRGGPFAQGDRQRRTGATTHPRPSYRPGGPS